MDPDDPDSADSESDLLLGLLDILDPDYLLRCADQGSEEPAVLLVGGGDPVPPPSPAALGAPPVKLEALNELIHFDHIYTKPVELVCAGQGRSDEEEEDEASDAAAMKIEDAAFPVEEVEVESVYVKEEAEEVDIPDVDDFFSSSSAPSPSPPAALCGGLEKAAASLADAYSDSGYERSPSPFSDMSSPLGHHGSWDDVFANELFPQLISV